ncbi:peptidylprolyl isomerase [Vibrio sp. ZSDZ65]|uniref:Peptidyl-prolyl cis-trans isomerase n=1 Tax=Vibrio qingdaonensis TaxID=2829491 RepID=A0A9X3CRQ3_9VIBR|nr:peptidylprolyl isomerase [Vibrio qingdaonensis]MCW8347295.1 peptidylprolyl isomerase [Vibrio qingdaonensis]
MMRTLISTLALMSATVFAAPTVQVDTNIGSFTVELNEEKAPVSVANFLRYVDDGSYVNSQFHRVIPGFMAQGGGFDEKFNRLPVNKAIQNEAANGLDNDIATIAMARTQDPDSATRQFFINYADNDFLNYSVSNPGYAVFGKVTEGFDVVKKMSQKPTRTVRGMRDVPMDPIIITKIERLP